MTDYRNLMERCKEVLAWKKTGNTEGDARRNYDKYSLLDFLSGGLQQAEKSTMDDAMMAVVELVALVEKLQSRVAELESRLEVAPEHDIDGIAARDATIKLQDGRIAELKFRLTESEDTNKALRVRLGSELERANELVADLQAECSELRGMAGAMDIFRSEMIDSGVIDINVPPMFFSESIIPRLLRLADMEKQEPVAWCIDGEDGREYNGTPKMSDGRIGTPLYAAPPVITQHEPVTTVEDRYNADGKSCHITDDLPAGMPLYAASPVAAPVRLTDSDVVDLFQAWNTTDGASHADLILSVETAVLRANGFKLEGEQ